MLVLALLVAGRARAPGTGSAPFRALAIVYTDIFRGTPLILVVFIVLGLLDARHRGSLEPVAVR